MRELRKPTPLGASLARTGCEKMLNGDLGSLSRDDLPGTSYEIFSGMAELLCYAEAVGRSAVTPVNLHNGSLL
jgi:hypothetical protein